MKNLIVAPAPHAHSGDSVRRNMLLVIIALLPAYVVSAIEFGYGVLITTAVSILACVATEWLISRYLLKEKRQTIGDLSAVLTGLLLAFNLPSNIDWWIVVIGAVVAIGVAKMSYGGLGQNLFNPALVGRVFLLISFPVQMTTWPTPNQGFGAGYIDATTGATPLAFLKQALKSGEKIADQLPSLMDSLLGAMGGSFGEVCALALIIGGLFLICTKVITWHIPISIIATTIIFSWILGYNPLLEVLSGGLLLGAVFMATDYVTSPMTKSAQIIYGTGIAIITIIIRRYGSYPEGVSFAILLMNSFTPLLNKYCKPHRFGERR